MRKFLTREQQLWLIDFAADHPHNWRKLLAERMRSGVDCGHIVRQLRSSQADLGFKGPPEGIFESQVRAVAKGYLDCAIWADCPEDLTHTVFTCSALTKREVVRQCRDFILRCGDDFWSAVESPNYGDGDESEATAEAQFGHDFWLTRQRHGTGFWDRKELPEDLRQRLIAAVQETGEADFYFMGQKFHLVPKGD